MEPDLLTFAIFCLFQGQKSNFQDTNALMVKIFWQMQRSPRLL